MVAFVLSVPEKRVSAWVAEANPRYARAWLETLPSADPVEAGREIYQSLYTLNRQDIDPQQRYELMGLYAPAMARACTGMQAHYLHLPFPLPPKKRQLAEFVRQLHMEMAYGYKCCLHDLARVRLPWTRKQLAGQATERGLHYLAEVLLRSYQVYMPYPPGLWREIHTLYRYAEATGREREPMNGEREPGAAQTVRDRYLQTLLLALANPYQLGQGDYALVQQFLQHWAGKASLHTDLAVTNPVGHFLVDLTADAPPTPFPRDAHTAASDTLRALNTVELVRHVHGFVGRLQKGESVRTLGLGLDCLEAPALDLMRRLVRAWALVPRRQHARLKRQGSVFLCAGLGAVHFFVNGQKPFALPPAAGGPAPDAPAFLPPPVGAQEERDTDADEVYIALDEPSAAEAASGAAARVGTAAADLYRVDRWQVRDLSARGLLLARAGAALAHVRVGEPLGIQRSNDIGHWSIGVVRWMKNADAASLELGVELLAPHAKPVALWPVHARARAENQVLALWLAPLEAMHRPATLLVARGVFRRDQDFLLYDGDSPAQPVRLLKQLERTGSYEQVLFAPIAAA